MLVLLALGADAHGDQPHVQLAVTRRRHRRARKGVREGRDAQSRRRRARRCRCRGRCRASCSRRSPRARAAICDAGTRTSAARVEKGELLAEIETPEIDQQLSQAIAARQQAAASLDLARSTIERWESLRKKDAVSQQELDERRSANAQAVANLAAADANVERLRQLEGFKRIVAPFAGVITRRNVDVGDLIDAGSSGGRALFLLAQTDPLRVYVNVPQTYSQLIKPGQKVVVTQAELRGRTFEGEVARTSASIDTTTRTMQVEVALPNRDGTLLPGAFVQVSLPLAASKALQIPDDGAADSRRRHSGCGRRCARHASTCARFASAATTARRSRCSTASTGTEQLVLNPSDSLAEGDQVIDRADRQGREVTRRADCSPRLAARSLVGLRRWPELPAARASTCRSPGRSSHRGARPRRTIWPQKGPWWHRFGDPQLDALEQQALAANPTLAAANARLVQARAQVASASSNLYPQVNVAARAGRQAISANRPQTNYSVAELLDGAGRLHRDVDRRATRSIFPAGSSGRSKAPRRRPSNRRPISRTRGCC